MSWKKFELIALCIFMLVLAATNPLGQGFLVVDQASGTLDEVLSQSTTIPNVQIAQSFTPSLSAVGFVQLSDFVTPTTSGETLVINLRQGSYNGPIVSSTTPLVLVPGPGQKSTFFFPDNVPVTPGQLYFFEPVLESAGPIFVDYKSPSSYPAGEAWNNGVPSGDVSDYWFREGVVVPEPGTVWLALLGSGVFVWRWRVGRNSRRRS